MDEEQLTISELIKCLVAFKKRHGDRFVFLSSDSEGNHFGTVTIDSFGKANEKSMCIFPCRENIEYEEMP